MDRSDIWTKKVDGLDLPREEQDLLERIASGDGDAFEQLFNSYWEYLHNVAYNRLGSVETADDLVQEVFTDFWNKRKSLQIHTSLKAYLYQALKYKVFNHIRHKSVRHKQEFKTLIREKYYPDHERTSTEKTVAVNELQQLMEQEIEKLPGKSRQIFQLSRQEFYTYREIANQLDCSIKTVEYHMSKVLRKLRVQLGRYQQGLLLLTIASALHLFF